MFFPLFFFKQSYTKGENPMLTPITQIYRERNSNETETDTRGFWGMRGVSRARERPGESDAAPACAKHGCGSRAHVRRGAQGPHAQER